MRLLDRYLLRELVLPLAIGAATALLLLLCMLFFQSAEEILACHAPVSLVLQWLALRLPELAVQGLPMAMAFSVALAINRMARDNELTPVSMAGVRFRRVMAPVCCAGIVAGVASYACAEWLTPWAAGQADRVERRMLLAGGLPVVRSRVVQAAGKYTFYVGRVSRGGAGEQVLEDLLVYDTSRSGLPVWYFAGRGDARAGACMLRRVVRHDMDAQGMSLNETYLPELAVDLGRDVDFLEQPHTRAEMRGSELRARARELAAAGCSDATLFLVDYHLRFAYPLACLVFGIIAAPVSFRFSRGGTFAGVLVSVIIAVTYYNAMFLARLLGYNQVLSPACAAWLIDFLFALLAGVLLLDADGGLPSLGRRPSRAPTVP